MTPSEMSLLPGLDALVPEVVAWRRELHAHPETAFEERFASDFVAAKLEGMGLEVTRGLAGTGVVGTLRGPGTRAIGLRADMDALHLTEANDFAHKSLLPGRMHACGHDGHMAMLLGAARWLSANGGVDGTVHFVFQPAEENEGGGRVMVEDGLFERFPMEAIFGMHNWPSLEVGKIAVRPGPLMAAYDVFEITLRGKGTHAAMPHLGTDALVAGAHLVAALQTIASRAVEPIEAAVVSVTQFHAGDTWNVIPDEAVLRGTVRTFRPHIQDLVERRLREITAATATSHGVESTVDYQRRYPATINAAAETALAARAAAVVVGADNVVHDPNPSMGAEDFAYMLQKTPGSYVWLGAGPAGEGRGLHGSRYDFNDAAIPVGIAYWVALAKAALS